MKIQHTSIPWDICESNNSSLIHIETALDHPACGGEQIATVNKGSREERLANAAFIVRACNAHEALLEALEDIFNEWGYPNTPKWAKAQAALAKAKGDA